MMCLICVLATPAFVGMGLSGSNGSETSTKLLAKTRSVYVASWLLPGTGMMFTVPIVLDFGEPTGGAGLLGPAPRPRALETYKVFPSALTCIAAGHHPTGI